MFLRKTRTREPLPITMTGVRMGERLLQIGLDDPAVAGAIAAKVGLSGAAAMAVGDEDTAARAKMAAAQSGALVDVNVTPLERLPYGDASFDVVVVHALRDPVGEPPGASLARLRDCVRVLRPGGRVVVISAGPKSGIGGLFRRSAPVSGDGGIAALTAAGFRPVRVVGELEGYRFVEGLRA